MFSMFRLSVAIGWGFALLVLAQAGTVRAQFPKRGPMPGRPQQPPIDARGTIEALGPGLIRIKSVVGQPYMLQLVKTTTVHITGTAKPDVLGRGSFVSFFAEVDQRSGEVQGKVGELTLFTPSLERPLGAFPGGRPKAAGQDPFGQNPLAADAGAGFQAPGAEQPPAGTRQRRTRTRRAAQNEAEGPAIQSFEIVGRIAGIDRAGKITVYARNPYFKPTVEIELTEDPHIELDLADPRMLAMVKPGDQVQARGQQVAPNVVQVKDLTIELAEPFTTVQPEEPEEKPPRRTSRTSRRSRAEAEEAVEAKEDVEAKEGVEPDEATEQPDEPSGDGAPAL
jgi:hypothetical protein